MSDFKEPAAPRVDARLRAILDQEFPKFSDAEIANRRGQMEAAMAEAGVDHLFAYGGGFGRSPITWLTQWPVTMEAHQVMSPGERDALFVQFYNHVPLARRMVPDVDVAWGGESTIASSIAELERRVGQGQRIGVLGSVPFGMYLALKEKFGDPVDLNRAYYRMRIHKTEEELDWFRIGAALADLSIDALRRDLRPGLTERDLGAITEHAFQPWGARNVIHFFGVTSMDDPDICVPTQWPSSRRIRERDVMFTEISANFWEYSGQVLRTYSVGAPLTPLYQDLHDAAEAAYDAIFARLRPGLHAREIVEAASVIEEAGFTIYDDLLHGGGGSYNTPAVGSPSRQIQPVPDVTLEPGMLLVIQPNVITKDEKAGVQVGEMVLITDDGVESIHTAPRGPFEV